MKHLLLSVAFFCYTWLLLAQTPQLNQEKYWKFRNRFKEQFVKIGSLEGESLPAGSLKPFDCIDNINNDGTGFGEMHWGDGMIRHGHYLVLLATEYRLLKNAGNTLQANATLNELYYALQAFRRLDIQAEENQDQIHGTNTILQNSYNGFYNREDTGEDFAFLNWGSDRMEMRCTNSAYYRNNNAAKINNGGLIAVGNSYQNVPSQDQMSSLLVGLSMVMKLVDPVTVQPSPQDQPRDLVAEARDGISKLITYASRNNWFLLDVHGWPVNNGGGELVLSAPALIRIFERWVGAFPLQVQAHRRLKRYDKVQEYVVGFGLDGPSTLTWEQLFSQQAVYGEIFLENNFCQPYPEGQFETSPFVQWQNCGLPINVNSLALKGLWQHFIPNHVDDLYTDFADDNMLNNTFGQGSIADFQLSQIVFNELPLKDYNNTIMFNLGVASGWWDELVCDSWADVTGNRQLELINCILNNRTPANTEAFYKSILDELTMRGPYKLEAGYYDNAQQTTTHTKYHMHPNGWAAAYKWTHKNESTDPLLGEKGIFSGLDYMVYYNLYHLLFGSQLPAYEESWSCDCTPASASGPINGPEDTEAYQNLNNKLSFVGCNENVFYPVNNLVTGTFLIQPKFSNYDDIGIYTTKYQMQNAGVLPTGKIEVHTRFVVCNGSTLTVQSGGKLHIEKKEMIVNTGGTVDLSGELRVKAGTALRLKSGLILRSGSMLIIEDGGQLIIEEGGVIEYYNGADFHTYGSSSKIVLRGIIRTMDAATFSIGTTQPNNSQRGKLVIEGTTAGFEALQPSTFQLSGTGINDNFIEIAANSRILANNSNINYFRISGCSVKIGSNSYISAQRTFQATNVKFHADADNEGVTIKGGNSFLGCTFQNVPLIGLLTTPGTTAKLQISESAFSNTGVNVNNGAYLVKVEGTGYSVGSCTFTAMTGTAHLLSENLTQPSSVSGSSFTETGATNDLTITAIQEKSNVELTVKSTTFNQLYSGIFKKYNKLTLKCNTFGNNVSYNISASNGCLVNMSTNDLGGYNVLNKPVMNRSVSLSGSSIALTNGYNYINDAGSDHIISGTFSSPCTGLGCLFSATQNQWNSGNTAPPASRFNLVSSNGNSLAVITSPVALKPACGFFDAPGGGISGRFFYDYDGMPLIWSASENDSVRMNTMVTNAIRMTTAYDSLGNDLLAIERFNEVFTNELDLTDSTTYSLAWQGFYHMKSAVETAIANEQITAAQNTTEFEPHVAMYINALMVLTDSVIDESNYLTQFYHEIDKAHLFRVIGHSQIGLNILNELEYCGLDSAEQAEINYWKTQFSEDLIIEAVGETAVDSIIIVDTSGYIQPQLAVNAYSFGANIQSLNDISYPNCDFFERRNARVTRDALSVYPNPATTSITIQLPGASGRGKLLITQADGRKVYAVSTDSDRTRLLNIPVNEWHPGTYQVHYTDPLGKSFAAKLIVQ